MKRKNLFSIFMLTTLFFSMIIISCGPDEVEDIECKNFPSAGREITFNGEVVPVSVAQLVAQSGGGSFGDVFTMQLGVITEDCNKQTTFSLNYIVNTGSKLNGTFKFVGFFDEKAGEGSGTIIEQKLLPLTQSSSNIASDTSKITDKGNKLYTLDISANVDGVTSPFTIKGDVQF